MASFLKFKHSVRVPKSLIIAAAAINAANQMGLEVEIWVTSGNDSVHMQKSKHYTDDALDFRTKHLTTEQKHLWLATIKKRLGKGYDVILEHEGDGNEHLHIEFEERD
jgi:NADPH:quinone reductase-like Zn-dependent oxidoreductase